MSTTNTIQEFSTDLLRVYYGRLFPYDAMFNWFSYGNDPSNAQPGHERDFFLRREFSFTIEDDIYIRYQCFKDVEELKAGIQKRQPHKIDIGAVFSAAPKDHTTLKPEAFKTVERELVFDIDMTDYDDIRTCCDGANICMRCWPFMTMAMKVIDRSVREDFGYKHILWIYSGRRGIHCWVCDPEARALPNEARDAIVTYLTVKVGTSENSDAKVIKSFKAPLHPLVNRAYEILEPYFQQYIAEEAGQGLLVSRKKYIPLINTLPNEEIRVQLYKLWDAEDKSKQTTISGSRRWQQLKDMTDGKDVTGTRKRMLVDYAVLQSWRVEVVMTYCYPRLDANVSKQQNHLLKSPFCVHPKTGRVCVPIDPEDADNFNPFNVPTVRVLCQQIDAYEGPDISDTDKTDMKAAMSVFEKSFMSDLKATIRRDFREKADQIAAMEVDF